MDTIKKFKDITGCMNESIAYRFLENSGMNLNSAIDHFFAEQYRATDQTAPNQANVNDSRFITAIFEKYCETPGSDKMDVDGTIQYFLDLGINPEDDVTAIIAAYILESPSQGVFLRDLFVKNWSRVNYKVDSLEGMTQYLNESKNNNDLMKHVYKFAFKYALEDGEKKLDVDSAIALWKVFYKDQFEQYYRSGNHTTVTKFVEDYLLAGKVPEKKQISRDEWEMALSFFQIPLEDLKDHSTAAAWPLLMDDFVDFLFERL